MPPSKSNHPVALFRARHLLTQKQLAEAIGCSPATIKAIELGKLKLSEKLARKITERFGPIEPPSLPFAIELNEWL